MAYTGTKNVLTLRKYVNGVATSETKANAPSDPDYIAPYTDAVDCPIGFEPTTTTTSTTTTTTSTTTTTGTPPVVWSSATTAYVSSTGASPVTQTVSGTVTISGSDQTFRAYVYNIFNAANVAEVSLTIDGVTKTINTGGASGTFYTDTIIKAAGVYGYSMTLTLNLTTPLTSGAAASGIQTL